MTVSSTWLHTVTLSAVYSSSRTLIDMNLSDISGYQVSPLLEEAVMTSLKEAITFSAGERVKRSR